MKKLKSQISDIPHTGITPDSYKQKKHFLRNWVLYLEHLRIHNTPLQKVDTEKLVTLVHG